MNTEKSVNLAMENASVIKRPILQSNDFILAGFKADEWETTLK